MTYGVGRFFSWDVVFGQYQGRRTEWRVWGMTARRLLSLATALGIFMLAFQIEPVHAQAQVGTVDTTLYLPAITVEGVAAQRADPEGVVLQPQPEEIIPAPEPEAPLPTPTLEEVVPTPEPEGANPTPELEEVLPTPEPEEVTPTPEPQEFVPTPVSEDETSNSVDGTSSHVLWQADMETGDLSQWHINNPRSVESDSGLCWRPANGVSTDQAHSGQYSMMMMIDSASPSGCRQFRKPEPATGEPLYYSAWYYFPEQVRVTGNWNLFQFKSKTFEFSDDGDSGVFWKLDVRNNQHGEMALILSWKGPIEGPRAGDGVKARQYYQTLATLPVREWVHVEIYLRQSEAFDGQVTVWQDGVEIFNMDNVRTRFPGGDQIWSVNNYGKGLLPNPTTLYIDDTVISRERVGP